MSGPSTGEILPGLWRYEAVHPEWTEDEGGAEGWEPSVAWWVLASAQGLVLVDPLATTGWAAVDRLVGERGGCAGIVRTCHWHQRSIAEASARYGVAVWAKPPADGTILQPFDRALRGGEDFLGDLVAVDVERADEVALWLPDQRALLFGDAMIRDPDGALKVCPDSWTQPAGGPARLRTLLGGLTEFPVEHVLVSHGPVVLGSGLESLQGAIG